MIVRYELRHDHHRMTSLLHELVVAGLVKEPIQYPAVVAYIVRSDGMMLSVTRKDTGELSFPGGKCNANESFHDALRRETSEEVGLVPIHWYLVYDGRHSTGRSVLAYRVVEWRGVARACEPGTHIAWKSPDVMANSFGADYHRRALAAAGLIAR